MTQNGAGLPFDNGMTGHLDVADAAAYLDGTLAPTARARVEQHLAGCETCRGELIAVSRVIRTRPDRRRWYVPAGIAAAAAIAFLLIWPRSDVPSGNYREPAVSTTVAPVGIAPRGPSAAAPRLVWTRVPHAQRYRLTVFDSAGSVMWESQSGDTAMAFPKTVRLRPGVTYFWQVEAETGFSRWIRSDVVEFMIRP